MMKKMEENILKEDELEKVSGGEGDQSTVMGAEVSKAALEAGRDHIRTATEGLGLGLDNGSTGGSTYAGVGGGSIRQETG